MKSYVKSLFFLLACGGLSLSVGCGTRGSFEQNINSKSVGETVVELQTDENMEIEELMDGVEIVDCEAVGYENGEENEISTSSSSIRGVRSGEAGGHVKSPMLCRENNKDKEDLISESDGEKDNENPMTDVSLKCVKVCDLLTMTETLLSLDRIQTHAKGKSCGEVNKNIQSRLGSCESQNENSEEEQSGQGGDSGSGSNQPG